VIPTDWTPVHRPADGELVGYLAPDGAPGVVVPRLLTGTPAGDARAPDAAHELLVAAGLAMLDRRWWCRLPEVLPAGILPAGSPGPDWSWRNVVVVETSPTDCRVRPEWAEPAELRAQAVLPVPVGDLLLDDPPG
jgi:hypothetical protein